MSLVTSDKMISIDNDKSFTFYVTVILLVHELHKTVLYNDIV